MKNNKKEYISRRHRDALKRAKSGPQRAQSDDVINAQNAFKKAGIAFKKG